MLKHLSQGARAELEGMNLIILSFPFSERRRAGLLLPLLVCFYPIIVVYPPEGERSSWWSALSLLGLMGTDMSQMKSITGSTRSPCMSHSRPGSRCQGGHRDVAHTAQWTGQTLSGLWQAVNYAFTLWSLPRRSIRASWNVHFVFW